MWEVVMDFASVITDIFQNKRNQTYFGFKVLTFHKRVLPDYGHFLYYPMQNRGHLQSSYAKDLRRNGDAFPLLTS